MFKTYMWGDSPITLGFVEGLNLPSALSIEESIDVEATYNKKKNIKHLATAR